MTIWLIDGRSGAGKTTAAKALGAQRRIQNPAGCALVHMDDLYPGWHGLRAGGDMVAHDVLRLPSSYQRWDWSKDQPGEWVETGWDPHTGMDLIVEGCGCLTEETLKAAKMLSPHVRTLFISGPESIRKERALHRDPDFAPWWDMWAAQEEQHIASMPQADATVDCSRVTTVEMVEIALESCTQ